MVANYGFPIASRAAILLVIMRSLLRTVALFLGAVLLTIVVEIVLMHLITPNKPALIVRIFRTPPSSPYWPEIYRQWNRVRLLEDYVISPLSGVIVGLFIGLLQKRFPVALALAVRLPETLNVWWSNRANIAAMSYSSIAMQVLISSIPFISTAIAAWVVHHLKHSGANQRRADGGSISIRSHANLAP